MKSLTVLWKQVAEDLAIRCCTSAHHDVSTVVDRSKNEGLSFLTITLPNFGKDFERCLDQGFVDNSVFLSFKKNRSLPAFLQGFSRLVFDRRTGVLLDEPNISAIHAIRQLTLMFSKYLADCSPRRNKRVVDEFITCDQEVKVDFSQAEIFTFQRVSNLLYSSLFSNIDREVYNGTLTPAHGPGATADSKYGNQKYHQTEWTLRLEEYFPYLWNVLPNISFWEQLEEVNFLEPETERPVKVTLVPKTMKSPRVIAIEPTCMQYVQQALRHSFYEGVKYSFLNSFIGFHDQKPNQLLARRGSSDGGFATLDLSEASDRVSSTLVSAMFENHPHLQGAVFSCRSSRALLPGGEVISLSKFASMGSALCFPIEAMVFLTIVFIGIEQHLGHHLTRSDVKSFSGKVRVFGDDIVIPEYLVRYVVKLLSTFGLKVNLHKSFWSGKFRESCGKEYYDGRDVSIARVRRALPSSRRDVQEIISAVSFRNQAFSLGLERTVSHLDRRVFKLLKHFPVVGESSPVLGRHTWDSLSGIPGTYPTPLVKGWKIRPSIPVNEIDDWPAMRKCFHLMNLRGSEVAYPADHLRRSGRPRVVDIKLGVGPSGF